jgi:hypothetical protein
VMRMVLPLMAEEKISATDEPVVDRSKTRLIVAIPSVCGSASFRGVNEVQLRFIQGLS